MPYLVIDNFSAGLDSRRHVLNSKDGTLAVLKNAHITRGGEIEKRKAFAQFADLPANTFGLETTQDKIYVFGSVPAPSMPAGVTYQRLQHPDGFAMTGVAWSTVYGGLPFVIAEYSNGNRLCFWDGAIISDWFVGVATAAMGTLENFAEHIKSDFSLAGYSISRSDSTLSITGPGAKDFDVSASITSPMTVSVTKTQSSSENVPEKRAKGSFAVTSGKESPATSGTALYVMDFYSLPGITGIYVNGTEITGLASGSTILWNSTPPPPGWNEGPVMARTLATFVNANTSSSGFSATNYNINLRGTDKGVFRLNADSAIGPEANGWTVQIEFESSPASVSGFGELGNNVVVSPYDPTRFVANFAGGPLSGGAYSGVTSVRVDGVEIMDEVVPWKASNSSTMLAIVSAINAFDSDVEYQAEIENNKVVLTAQAGLGASPNGLVIEVDTQGDTVVSSVVNMSGGVDAVAGAPQISQVSIGGVFQEGGSASITINDPDLTNPYVFGSSRVGGKSPVFSITYKAKEYAAVGPTMYFSGLNDATKWDIYDLGSGFIDMSNNFGGREDITGFGVYQDKLAVFSRRNVQLWFLDADPAQNQQLQILANTGAIAPDSVVSVGAIDLLYLADNGVRSLRAREGTDTAFANDIGSPVDNIIISHMDSLTDDQKYAAKAIVEPVDGRYWLALGDKIYVISYFPGANISAWSIYEPGFSVSQIATRGTSVYVRSGNTIYIYGGASGSEYDSSEVVVELPYLDARKPATFKRSKGVDVTIEGEWKIYMGFDHTNPGARDLIATPNQPTFALGKIDAVGVGTHFGVRLVSQAPGAARVANLIVHYDEMHAKHEAG